jgi:hypothetical protein
LGIGGASTAALDARGAAETDESSDSDPLAPARPRAAIRAAGHKRRHDGTAVGSAAAHR